MCRNNYTDMEKAAAIILSNYLGVYAASQLLQINQSTVSSWYARACNDVTAVIRDTYNRLPQIVSRAIKLDDEIERLTAENEYLKRENQQLNDVIVTTNRKSIIIVK